MSHYLDHASTTPVLPEVIDAMIPWLSAPANPASAHRAGQRAAVALEEARAQVAAALGRDVAGIVFTSGATEANHHALYGWVRQAGPRVAVSGLEHPSVHGAIARAGGVAVDWPVAPAGVVRPDERPEADVVCLMAVNHETGVVQPVAEVARALAEAGVPLHVDASQALGKPGWDSALAHSVAASGHKIGGPVGVGVLSLRAGDPLPAWQVGGAQERGRRGGTVDVAGAVGFGVACAAATRERAERTRRWGTWSARIAEAARAAGGRIAGEGTDRVATHTCAVFPGIPGETLVQALDLAGIEVSSGAACASGSREPSPVLIAMDDPDPGSGLRISLGPSTTAADVDAVVAALPRVVARVRDALRVGFLGADLDGDR